MVPFLRHFLRLFVALLAITGAAGAQGSFEVDEAAAERAIERALVQTGSVLLSPRAAEIVPFLTFQRSEDEIAGVPNLVQGQLVGSTISRQRERIEGGLILRTGLPWAGQVDLVLPLAYASFDQEQNVLGSTTASIENDTSGVGDIRVSYTQSLRPAGAGFPNILAAISYDSDTGGSNDAVFLGSGFNELGLSLTVTQRQDPLVFSGRLRWETAFEKDDVEPGDTIGFDFGTFLSVNPETSLQFGLSMEWREEAEFQGRTLDGTDQFSAVFNVGLATILRRNTLLDASLGIGLTEDAPDLALALSLPIGFAF